MAKEKKETAKDVKVESREVGSKKQKTFIEKEGNSLDNQSEKKGKFHWIWKALLVLILGVVVAVVVTYSWYNTRFKETSGVPVSTLISQVRAGMKNNPYQNGESVNFLIAGLDEIQNQKEGSMLTDTLLIMSVNKSGDIYLLSIPRDLWLDDLKTKINALYFYGEESEETTGEELLSSVVGDITGLSIDKVMVLKLDSVEKVIDGLGGVEVEVQNSFVDDRFPRADVDINVSDPALLYETVSFTKGKQSFDGETALKFMRSRNSEDEFEGTDEGRRARQQLIVASLMRELQNPNELVRPEFLGKVYALWNDMFAEWISIEELVGMVYNLDSYEVKMVSVSIPIETEEEKGILTVNKVNGSGQWVYEPNDPSFEELREFVRREMGKN